MPKKRSASVRFMALGAQLKELVPSLNEILTNEEDFISLQIKMRPDGSCLTVVKQYGEDGGPMVLFGSGYGVPGALMAADAAATGGRWRPDKPFKSSKA